MVRVSKGIIAECSELRELTIYSLALCQVAIALSCEQRIAISAHDTLDVPGGDVVEHALRHGGSAELEAGGSGAATDTGRRIIYLSSARGILLC